MARPWRQTRQNTPANQIFFDHDTANEAIDLLSSRRRNRVLLAAQQANGGAATIIGAQRVAELAAQGAAPPPPPLAPPPPLGPIPAGFPVPTGPGTGQPAPPVHPPANPQTPARQTMGIGDPSSSPSSSSSRISSNHDGNNNGDDGDPFHDPSHHSSSNHDDDNNNDGDDDNDPSSSDGGDGDDGIGLPDAPAPFVPLAQRLWQALCHFCILVWEVLRNDLVRLRHDMELAWNTMFNTQLLMYIAVRIADVLDVVIITLFKFVWLLVRLVGKGCDWVGRRILVGVRWATGLWAEVLQISAACLEFVFMLVGTGGRYVGQRLSQAPSIARQIVSTGVRPALILAGHWWRAICDWIWQNLLDFLENTRPLRQHIYQATGDFLVTFLLRIFEPFAIHNWDETYFWWFERRWKNNLIWILLFSAGVPLFSYALFERLQRSLPPNMHVEREFKYWWTFALHTLRHDPWFLCTGILQMVLFMLGWFDVFRGIRMNIRANFTRRGEGERFKARFEEVLLPLCFLFLPPLMAKVFRPRMRTHEHFLFNFLLHVGYWATDAWWAVSTGAIVPERSKTLHKMEARPWWPWFMVLIYLSYLVAMKDAESAELMGVSFSGRGAEFVSWVADKVERSKKGMLGGVKVKLGGGVPGRSA